MSLMSPALAGEFFTTTATWEAQNTWLLSQKNAEGLVAQSVVKSPLVNAGYADSIPGSGGTPREVNVSL